jgi:hypothetical protein
VHGAAAACFVVVIPLPEPVRIVGAAAGLAILVVPAIVRSTRLGAFPPVDERHLLERFGAFTIIVCGESCDDTEQRLFARGQHPACGGLAAAGQAERTDPSILGLAALDQALGLEAIHQSDAARVGETEWPAERVDRAVGVLRQVDERRAAVSVPTESPIAWASAPNTFAAVALFIPTL